MCFRDSRDHFCEIYSKMTEQEKPFCLEIADEYFNRRDTFRKNLRETACEFSLFGENIKVDGKTYKTIKEASKEKTAREVLFSFLDNELDMKKTADWLKKKNKLQGNMVKKVDKCYEDYRTFLKII